MTLGPFILPAAPSAASCECPLPLEMVALLMPRTTSTALSVLLLPLPAFPSNDRCERESIDPGGGEEPLNPDPTMDMALASSKSTLMEP